MVASDDRLPHQIFARGKMNNAIKTPSKHTFAITHYTFLSEDK